LQKLITENLFNQQQIAIALVKFTQGLAFAKLYTSEIPENIAKCLDKFSLSLSEIMAWSDRLYIY
jgi:hypothetical protein